MATAANKTFTASILNAQAQQTWQNRQKIIADARLELFAKQVSDILLLTEAAARKTTVGKILETEVAAKVADPSAEQIKAIYDANQDRLENKPLAEVRPQLIAFLRREPEQKATENFIAALKTKYKPVFGKDVNAPDLKPADILATVGLKQITAKDFEDANKLALYELDAKIYDLVESALRDAVASELLVTEAVEQQTTPGAIIAREVTDKMKDYSNEERFASRNGSEQSFVYKIQRENFNQRTRRGRSKYFDRRRSFARQCERAGDNRDVFRFPMFGVFGGASDLEKSDCRI